MCVNVCIYVRSLCHTHAHAQTCTHTHARTHAHTHTRTHTRTRTRTHTHTHAPHQAGCPTEGRAGLGEVTGSSQPLPVLTLFASVALQEQQPEVANSAAAPVWISSRVFCLPCSALPKPRALLSLLCCCCYCCCCCCCCCWLWLWWWWGGACPALWLTICRRYSRQRQSPPLLWLDTAWETASQRGRACHPTRSSASASSASSSSLPSSTPRLPLVAVAVN